MLAALNGGQQVSRSCGFPTAAESALSRKHRPLLPLPPLSASATSEAQPCKAKAAAVETAVFLPLLILPFIGVLLACPGPATATATARASSAGPGSAMDVAIWFTAAMAKAANDTANGSAVVAKPKLRATTEFAFAPPWSSSVDSSYSVSSAMEWAAAKRGRVQQEDLAAAGSAAAGHTAAAVASVAVTGGALPVPSPLPSLQLPPPFLHQHVPASFPATQVHSVLVGARCNCSLELGP